MRRPLVQIPTSSHKYKCGFAVIILITALTTIGSEVLGPEFAIEPPRLNYFTNEKGLSLHCISIRGTVIWLDGQSLLPLPVNSFNEEQHGLSYGGRHFESLTVFPNGTLYFPPFSMSDSLRTFHCAIENEAGRILSREVLVRPVIKEYFDEVRIQSDNYATEGNDILLQCSVPETAKPFIRITSWMKDSDNIFPYSNGGGTKYIALPSGELLIEKVTIGDTTSTFRCRIQNTLTDKYAFSETSARIHLSPLDKTGSKREAPVITSLVTTMRAREGETVVLFCLSQGNPRPKHEWSKSNGHHGFEALYQTSRIFIRESVLILENAELGDTGTYICYANNSRGSDRLRIQVVVSPAVASVELLPKFLTVDAGKSAEFTCWTNVGEEYPYTREIEWRKDGSTKLLRSNWRATAIGDKLRIIEVAQEDAGMYQCMVKIKMDAYQAAAQLKIGDIQPKFTYKFIEHTINFKGTRVSLKCSAVGNPSPTIHWLIDGFPLPNSERILIGQYVTANDEVISHLNVTTIESDGGEYSCTATNRVGSVQHKARLNIYGPPLVRNTSGINAVAGKDFKIKCPVSGYPIDKITFTKDNQLLPVSRRQSVSSDGVLTIKEVEKNTDDGFYSCTANSKGQQHTNTFHVKVVVPPALAPFMGFPATVVEGERVVVYCVVKDGDAPLQLQWLRDSRPVESAASAGEEISTQQIGDDIGLVLIISKVKVAHAATNFTCLARNPFGVDSLELKGLVVQVSPRIAKFTFSEQISEGHRVQANCAVDNHPDLPLLFTWFKNEDKILEPMKYELKVIQVDTFSSMLIIDSVNSKHTGNYTCRAKNFATASFSQELIVRVKPKWVIEPEDTHVTEGEAALIPCQSDGNPVPVVSWKRTGQGTVLVGSYQDIVVHTSQTLPTDIVSYPNGSLFIPTAQTSFSGAYVCEAVNGIGSGLSKLVYLNVNVPVRVVLSQNSTSREGNSAVLLCEFSGAPPVNVAWYRDFQPVNPKLDFGYQVHTVVKNNGRSSSELTLTHVKRSDAAQFTCSGSNKHGKDSAHVWLIVQEPPAMPRNLHVISKTSRLIHLRWEISPAASGATEFYVKYANITGVWTSIPVLPERTDQISYSVKISNLKPFTTYVIVIVVSNEVGESESEKFKVRTNGESPNSSPRNVRAKPLDSTKVKVVWEHLDVSQWNDASISYRVGYKRHSDEEASPTFITLDKTDLVLSQLSPFTAYEVVVQAFNSLGPGPMTESLVVQTMEGVPNVAPRALTCFALTSQKLQLSWSALSEAEACGVVKGYKVFLELTELEDPDLIDQPLIRTISSTNLVVGGLAKFTNYSVRILGSTKAGDGMLSTAIYCRTKEDLPGPPAAIKAVRNNASSLTISWHPPATDQLNGQLTKYTAYILSQTSEQDSESASVQTKALPPDITHLEVNAELHSLVVFVAASTRVGDGANISIALRAPINKHGLNGSILSFGTKHLSPWKTEVRLPCEAVGSPRVSRTWYRFWEPIIGKDRYTFDSGGFIIMKDLRREDSGNFTCSVRNRFGVDSITHVLIVQVPPFSPSQFYGFGNDYSSIKIQWKVADSGDAPIKGFILHLKESDEWTELQISRHLNEFLIPDLICGRKYQMYMTAYNRVGVGTASRLLNVSTLGSVPIFNLPSPELMILHINSTWITVLLADAWNHSCPVLNHQLMYREQSSEKRWISASNELSPMYKRTVDLIGLQEGTVYVIKVVVTNSAGSSQKQVTVKTLSSIADDNARIMSDMNRSISSQLYFDLSVALTILLTAVLSISITLSLCWYYRKKSMVSETNSEKTTSSSNYFKPGGSSDQVYMTVKKANATPLHDNLRDFPGLEHSMDDIYPYATFELRDGKNHSHYEHLDFRRSRDGLPLGNQAHSERSICKSQHPRAPSTFESGEDEEEEDGMGEEEDFASESDLSEEPPTIHQQNRIYLHELGNTSKKKEKSFQSHPHVRHTNTYERVLPSRNCSSNWQHGMRDSRNVYKSSLTKDGKSQMNDRMLLGLVNVHSACPQNYYGRVIANLEPPKAFCDAKNDDTCCDD